VRDISRNLGISKSTVIAELKKKAPAEVNHAYAEKLKNQGKPGKPGLDVEICVDADEFWSFVGDTSNQRWTWYAIDRNGGQILAHHNGRRTDEACEALIAKLDIFPIRSYYTDNWQSYAKYIPADKHRTGKEHTWKIERTNLNFRTHRKRVHRKTICFSKDKDIHDNVIGLYIERHYYKNTYYAKAA
jgi:insertion element IS1 protein InsB